LDLQTFHSWIDYYGQINAHQPGDNDVICTINLVTVNYKAKHILWL